MTDHAHRTPAEVLLVEDNPGDVVLTRKALERSKVEINLHVVTDGEAALDFLHRRGDFADAPTPDFVLLDINLPKISGTEVLEQVKQSKTLRHIPIIMLSGSSRQSDVKAAYEAHANSYIIKRPELKDLQRVIESLEEFWLVSATLPSKADDDH